MGRLLTHADPFNQGDPFAGSGGKTTSIDASVGSKADKIHIREPSSPLSSTFTLLLSRSFNVSGRRLTTTGLQQRNGRKTLTTVQGLPEKYDPKKLLKAMKKEFACNGTVVSSADSDDEDAEGAGAGADDAKAGAKDGGAAKPNFGQILQFQGDQRTAVKEFLVKAGLYSEKEAKDKIVM